MTWFDRHPLDLAEQSEPAEALAAVKAQDELTARDMAVLDVCLCHWVLALLNRPLDPEGTLELQQLCKLARRLAPETEEARALGLRWKAFGDLLEGKRRTLQANAEAAPAKLLHEDRILQRIAESPEKRLQQSELISYLALSPGRVSQVLGVLESQGKVARSKQGKNSWIRLGANTPGPASFSDSRSAHSANDSHGIGEQVRKYFGQSR